MELKDHNKNLIENKEFVGEVRDTDFSQHELSRVYGVNVIFVNVSFKQAELSRCYFRNCRFIKCTFTGASIRESTLKGSQFEECDFNYTMWEKTNIDEHFLESCLPSEENLARDLVRSLRVNFSQIGNYDAVNKASSIEVRLTGQHLYNAAYSKQSYYRSKYKSWSRVKHGIEHARWKALDLLWGNGESIVRVIIAGIVAVVVAAAVLLSDQSKPSVETALRTALNLFWGLDADIAGLDYKLSVPLTISRYVLFGLFMAILVKRLSRR